MLADSFYEWMKVDGQRAKRPYRFSLKSEQPFAFAGIWNVNEGGDAPQCAIITTEPNGVVGKVHDRMPAILRPEAEAEWLNLDTTPKKAQELLVSYPDSEMKSYEVSTFVNSPENDTPEVIKSITL